MDNQEEWWHNFLQNKPTSFSHR